MAFKTFNVAKAGSLIHAFYVNVFGLKQLIWKFWLNLVWNFDKIPVVAISLQNTVSTIWKTWNKLSIYFFSIFILLYRMAGSRIADPILKL